MSRCRIRRRMRNCRRRHRSLLWAVKPAAMRASRKPYRVLAAPLGCAWRVHSSGSSFGRAAVVVRVSPDAIGFWSVLYYIQ